MPPMDRRCDQSRTFGNPLRRKTTLRHGFNQAWLPEEPCAISTKERGITGIGAIMSLVEVDATNKA
jgi:hypothetical protein